MLFATFATSSANSPSESGETPRVVSGSPSSPGPGGRCRVERSLLWEITGSLAAAGNDSRVGKELLFSKPKIVVKQTVFNRAHTKDPRPTSSIQR